MTEQEIDNLKPGDMIKWEYVDGDMTDTIVIYGAYTHQGVGDYSDEYTFTVLLDLSTGYYGGDLRAIPGEKLMLMYGELESECSLVTEIPSL